jgi:hypothetical protein
MGNHTVYAHSHIGNSRPHGRDAAATAVALTDQQQRGGDDDDRTDLTHGDIARDRTDARQRRDCT